MSEKLRSITVPLPTQPTVYSQLNEGETTTSEPEESDFALAEFLITAVGPDNEVVSVLSDWCLDRPLAESVIRSLAPAEAQKRWRSVRIILRCKRLPSDTDLVAQVAYLRSLLEVVSKRKIK